MNNNTFVYQALLICSLSFFGCSGAKSESSAVEEALPKYNLELLAMVKKDGKYGYINPLGEYEIESTYDNAMPFSEGLACVGVKKGRNISYFFINRDGERAFEQGVSAVSFFLEGYAAVRIGGRICFIDKEGKSFGNYKYANNFREGLALVTDLNGQVGFVDTTGEMVVTLSSDIRIQDVEDFHHGRAAVLSRIPIGKGKSLTRDLWGYINKKGEQRVEPEYRLAYSFSDGFARVLKDKQFGFVNSQGQTLTGFEFRDALDFSDGVAAVKKGETYGFIDTLGQNVLDYQYFRVKSFGDGLAPIMAKHKRGYAWGYINKKGEWITEPVYSEAYPFRNGYGIFAKREKYMSFGYLDTEGDTAVAPIFDYASDFMHPDSTNEMEIVLTAQF